MAQKVKKIEPNSITVFLENKRVPSGFFLLGVPLAQAGRHRRKVTYDSKPPVPTPRPQRSTCERLAYVLLERRM